MNSAGDTKSYPSGKLPHNVLARLLAKYTQKDERLIVAPGIGEDAAVIRFGDRCVVAKTDPITFATDAVGWYAVNVNANDIAAMGGTPRFFLATIIIPEDQATEELIESIFHSIHKAAQDLGITVCGGHTEVTHGIDRPIVVGQMLGDIECDRVVRSSGLVPGDILLLTKGMAIEATAIIAREKRKELSQRGYEDSLLDRYANYLFNPGISVVADARIALEAAEVHAMHDPTEGGVATGLQELAAASQVGLEVFPEGLFCTDESRRLCAEFGLDPFGIISSGALLIGCAPTAEAPIATALQNANIRVDRIAKVVDQSAGLCLIDNDRAEPLPHFEVDEIVKLFTK